jgi:type IV secretion system protein TrbL
VTRLPLILAGFPNPIGWTVDKVKGFVGDAASEGFEAVIGGLTAWVIDAVVWIVGGVFNFLVDSTDPNVQADWFIMGDGPYATTATIGATLLVGFTLVGITQGAIAGDVGGMLRRMALDLPLAVVGMVGLVTITQTLIRLTDALSGGVLDNFADDVNDFSTVITSLSALSGGTATAFVIFVLGLVTVIAGIIVVAELVVRAALIYIVVALAPLVFAAQLWPALRGVGRKLLEILVALILSKLVIAVALAVSAAALVGSGSGGEVTALPPPEIVAEDPGGSVTQAFGILLAAMAAFGVSAFSPLLITKLMPITEAAVVAAGIKGAPVRTAQQALSVGSYARIARGSAGGGALAAQSGMTAANGSGAVASGTPVGAGAGPGAAVAVAGTAAVSAAAKGIGAGTGIATGTAEQQRAEEPSSGPKPRRPPHADGGDDGR